MIAVAGLDMAAWTRWPSGPCRWPHSSAARWATFRPTTATACGCRARRPGRGGGRAGGRRQLRCPQAAPRRDRLAGRPPRDSRVRTAVGTDVHLMVDFNQGLTLGDALGAAMPSTIRVSTGSRSRSPTTTSTGMRSCARAADAGAARRELLRAARAVRALELGRRRLRDARPDAHRWRLGMVAFGADRRRRACEVSTHLYPEGPRI